MDKNSIDYIIGHRVLDSETKVKRSQKEYRNDRGVHFCYEEIELNAQRTLERRTAIREILKNTSFCNLSNYHLDRCRIIRYNDECLFEDYMGYETAIKGQINDKQAKFRRIYAMIPFRYQNLRGKDFNWDIYGVNVESQKRIVNGFVSTFEKFRKKGKGLYIYSATKGTGKTMLACCLLNELSHRYTVSTKFVTILDLLEMTKKGFYGPQDDIDSIYKSGVLVLDDIGVQMKREWVNTVLFRLINDRYNNERITIYTSNLPIDKLMIDERVSERIEADTFCIDMPEVSIRKRETERNKKMQLEEILKPGQNEVHKKVLN